jgi:hypothetical protein
MVKVGELDNHRFMPCESNSLLYREFPGQFQLLNVASINTCLGARFAGINSN